MQIQNAYDDDAIIARNNEAISVMTFLNDGARGERQIYFHMHDQCLCSFIKVINMLAKVT